MKKTKKIVYPALVKEEAKNLRKFATPRELSYLDFTSLDPGNASSCIYGQMTDNCFSLRAIELIERSCKRVYNESDGINALVGCKLNGSPLKSTRVNYWSPIEVFIYKIKNQENGANAKLISYLKGEIKRL